MEKVALIFSDSILSRVNTHFCGALVQCFSVQGKSGVADIKTGSTVSTKEHLDAPGGAKLKPREKSSLLRVPEEFGTICEAIRNAISGDTIAVKQGF